MTSFWPMSLCLFPPPREEASETQKVVPIFILIRVCRKQTRKLSSREFFVMEKLRPKKKDGISWKPRKQKKKIIKFFVKQKSFIIEGKKDEKERKRESKMAKANESWQHFLQLLVESEVDFASKPTHREASPRKKKMIAMKTKWKPKYTPRSWDQLWGNKTAKTWN